MAGTAFGQSNLPLCRGDPSYWTNCFGEKTLNAQGVNNTLYRGEFKNGKFEGYVKYTKSVVHLSNPEILKKIGYRGD